MRNDTYTGAMVRMRPNMTVFDGRVRPGQRGIVLRVSNVSHPPVQVRWVKMPGIKDSFNSSYYLHWQQLELLSTRAEVAAMRAKDAATLGSLTVGKSRVRMLRDFEKVVKGDEGTYIGTNGGFPPAQIQFEPTNGTKAFTYYVYVMDFVAIGQPLPFL